jgi:hypothetical protein
MLAIEAPAGYSGEITKSATVMTNDPVQQSFSLILRAYFKPDENPAQPPAVAPPSPLKNVSAPPPAKDVNLDPHRAGPFLVEPGARWVTVALKGSSSSITLSLFNPEENPVRIKRVIPGGDSFAVRLETIQPGKRYGLFVATNPALKPGQYKQTVRVITDSRKSPEASIQLEATVYSLVFVIPESIALQPLKLGADLYSFEHAIVIRKVRQGGLQIKRLSSNLPFIGLELVTLSEGESYRIKMTFDPSKISGPGAFEGKIRIETNDADRSEIEIPVSGYFYR